MREQDQSVEAKKQPLTLECRARIHVLWSLIVRPDKYMPFRNHMVARYKGSKFAARNGKPRARLARFGTHPLNTRLCVCCRATWNVPVTSSAVTAFTLSVQANNPGAGCRQRCARGSARQHLGARAAGPSHHWAGAIQHCTQVECVCLVSVNNTGT